MDCVGESGDEFKKKQYLKILKIKFLGEKKILKGGIALILFHWVLFFPTSEH